MSMRDSLLAYSHVFVLYLIMERKYSDKKYKYGTLQYSIIISIPEYCSYLSTVIL
jgi:hypothetical protein